MRKDGQDRPPFPDQDSTVKLDAFLLAGTNESVQTGFTIAN